MYIPTWLIVTVAIVGLLIYRSKKKSSSVEAIEKSVHFQKEWRIFSLEHFDSPHFIDVQDAFDAMEVNYFRLKQRFSHTPEKVLEIAKDWYRYAYTLGELKSARVMLNLDWDDDAWDRAGERMKEPSITKEELEKKFKSLLGKDWQNIPLPYFKRMEIMKKPDKKIETRYGLGNVWKYYYQPSENLFNLEEKRRKQKEQEAKEKEKPIVKAQDLPPFKLSGFKETWSGKFVIYMSIVLIVMIVIVVFTGIIGQ